MTDEPKTPEEDVLHENFENSPEWENPQFPPVGADSKTSLEDSPSADAPKKRKKTRSIAIAATVTLLVLSLVGWFGGNALVSKLAEENLKDSFTSEGFSKVEAEINSDPMLLSYLKGNYRHLRITAGEATLQAENAKEKTEMPGRIKDVVIDAYDVSRDDNRVKKGNVSFTLPREELDKLLTDNPGNPPQNVKHQGNVFTIEQKEDGFTQVITMRLHFKPGENGKSGKLLSTIENITINGSDELLGQKLHPSDVGQNAEQEVITPLPVGMVLKDVKFLGNDMRYILTFNNLALDDLT